MSYYRKWTKPGHSVAKKALDMLLRATMSGMKRRYLLTGPSQVSHTPSLIINDIIIIIRLVRQGCGCC